MSGHHRGEILDLTLDIECSAARLQKPARGTIKKSPDLKM